MNKTSLYEKHVALGAKMVDFAGWEMPIQYNNLKEEVLAVRNEVGVFDVSHMGEFFVEGNDTYAFLNYLLPNEIVAPSVGKAIYSPLLREDGTIIDDLIVYKLSDVRAMICVNASNIEKDFNWISQQAKEFDVRLSNKSDEYSLIAIQGPKAFEVMNNMASLTFLEDIAYYSITVDDPNNENPTVYARTGYTGEDGFEIFGSHKFIAQVWDELMALRVKACGLGARDVLRMEVCFPLYGNELTDEVTPLDSALGWTVKMDKTNFIGKEALSKTSAQFQLVKLSLSKGIPRAGYTVLDQNENPIGIITSGTMSIVTNKGIAIARVEKNKINAKTKFQVDIRNKKYEAVKQVKAFVTGGHK